MYIKIINVDVNLMAPTTYTKFYANFINYAFNCMLKIFIDLLQTRNQVSALKVSYVASCIAIHCSTCMYICICILKILFRVKDQIYASSQTG